MKWFAVLLALVNVGLWYFGASQADSEPEAVAQGEGTLPRVATLKAASAPVEPAHRPPPDPYCTRLGWFDNEAGARSAGKAMGLDDDRLAVEQQERALAPLHWVLIPPQAPERARAEFREIQRRGIDSYLVTEGENSFAISLGLFESKTSAISVLEEKKRQNLNAILAIFPRNQISYVLVFKAGHLRNAEEIRAAEADYRQKFDLVEIGRCEGVATPENNP